MAEPGLPPGTDRSEASAENGTRGRILVALIVGQVGMHSAMAGLRMAAPLQALREGYSAWSVGLLLALFAPAAVAAGAGLSPALAPPCSAPGSAILRIGLGAGHQAGQQLGTA